MQKVQKANFKKFNAGQYKVGLVVAQFNRSITEGLEVKAKEMLNSYFVPEANVQVYRVAGSVEIPVVLNSLAKSNKFDCLVALGAVIKGETPHFDYVSKIVSEGVLRVMLDYNLPVGFGVLTTNNYEQAQARLNVGGEAVEAALQTAQILKMAKR